MIEQDTIKLLRECDAGIKMGIASIDDVQGHVTKDKLSQLLGKCKEEHDKLKTEVQTLTVPWVPKSSATLRLSPALPTSLCLRAQVGPTLLAFPFWSQYSLE